MTQIIPIENQQPVDLPVNSNIDDLLNQQAMQEPTEQPAQESHQEVHQEAPLEVAQEAPQENAQEIQTDDYGNEVDTSEKMFSQSQLNDIMQDRVNRLNQKHQQDIDSLTKNYQAPQNPAPQQYQQQAPVENYQPVPTPDNNPVDWQSELNQHIDQRVTARETERYQKEAARVEQEAAAKHEQTFINNASKYSDFQDVISKSNLNPTDAFAKSLRILPDAAGFLYAASKTNASELNRISNINDPSLMTAELARLDERMKKPAQKETRTPAPIKTERGDHSHKSGVNQRGSIDSLIAEHNRNLQRRGR